MTYKVFDNIFWWQATEDIDKPITDFVQVLSDEQSAHFSDLQMHLGLYGGSPVSQAETAMVLQGSILRQPRLTFNVIHSVCQSATSKIAKHRPKMSFLTEGGNWGQRQKGRLLQKFMQGMFYSLKVYQTCQKAFLDACISGTGAVKIYTAYGEPRVERVPMSELYIDHVESRYGNPRQMFQAREVSRHVLAAMFPDKEKAILAADKPEEEKTSSVSRETDMVECIEAWHLRSGPEASDGRHCIVIPGATLVDEPYEDDYFPFAFVRWTEAPDSFWGNGLAREVKGIQVEINKLLARIQEQMHLATPKVFIEDTAKIVQSHLNNRIWGAIKYRGTPPQFFVPRSVSGEMFQHLDRLVDRAYEMTGISQLSASSKKPVGLESGRALREFSDIETERFMVVGQAYEELFVEISRQLIDRVRDLHANKENYEAISFSKKDGVEKLKWTDINMKDDEFIMQVQPTGSLPSTPAAKLASVIEMQMNGLFTKEEAHQLLDFPDLESATQLKLAPLEMIDKVIEEILEYGRWLGPDPFMNLELAIRRMQHAYNKARIDEAPEDRLEMLRKWIAQAVVMLKKATQETMMAQAAMAGGMPPPGAGPPGPGGLPNQPPPGPMGAPPQGGPPQGALARRPPTMGPPPGLPPGPTPGPRGLPPGPQ